MDESVYDELLDSAKDYKASFTPTDSGYAVGVESVRFDVAADTSPDLLGKSAVIPPKLMQTVEYDGSAKKPVYDDNAGTPYTITMGIMTEAGAYHLTVKLIDSNILE